LLAAHVYFDDMALYDITFDMRPILHFMPGDLSHRRLLLGRASRSTTLFYARILDDFAIAYALAHTVTCRVLAQIKPLLLVADFHCIIDYFDSCERDE
jgi:hypothetical protein